MYLPDTYVNTRRGGERHALTPQVRNLIRRRIRNLTAILMLVGCGARGELDERPALDAPRADVRDASVLMDASPRDGATDADAPDGGSRACRADGRGRVLRPAPAAYELGPGYRVEPGIGELNRIVIGDPTGDGRAEVIAVGNDGSRVVVFVQQEDGTLAARPSHWVGVSWPVVAVIDGDGHDDVVVGRPRGLEVLLGRDDGELEHTAVVPVEVGWRSAVADVDGDGHEDVVAITADHRGLMIAHGTGAGSLDRVELLSPPGAQELIGLGVGDVDGDRLPDLLAATHVFGTGAMRSAAYLHGLNRGGGDFPADAWSVQDVPEAHGWAWFAPGDFDADGFGDFVAVLGGRWDTMRGSTPILFSAGGSTGARLPRTLRVSHAFAAIAGFDLDMDGRSDVVTIEDQYSISISRGTAPDAMLYGLPSGGRFEWAWALAAGDVDCDGCPDVVTSDAVGLVVFRGRGCR